MRAIVCESFDSPEKLNISEVDKPEPGDDDVIVRVEATGLGYVDALTVAGRYQIKPPLPFIPGNEIAGTIDAVGANVTNVQPGQRVLAMPPYGGLAEYVRLPAVNCLPIPDDFAFEAAAGFLVNYCTAWHGFFYCGHLKANETVLILGASGGVGVAAIDVARCAGAYVIAAASTEEKRAACIDAGADVAIDYTKEGWRDDLKTVLDGKPLNVVYDPVGGDFAEPALRSLAPDGRFLVVGFAAGDIPKIPLNLALLKQVSITGVNWGGHLAVNPGARQPVVEALLAEIGAGRLHPAAGETYPLAGAGAAMMKMLGREAIGKVVIHNQA